MWYDLLIAAILIVCVVRGARKGFLTQVAGIAGLVLAFVFAETASPYLMRYLDLGERLNRWVAMLAVYLAASFLTFAIARSLRKSLEKAQFADFDRHLGLIIGGLKGALIAMVVSYFAVTLEQTRPTVLASYSGYASATVLNEVKPLLPEELNPYLDPYLEDFEGVENPWKDGLPLRLDADAADRALAADDDRRDAAGPITLDDIRTRFGGYARDELARIISTATEAEGERMLEEVARAEPDDVLSVLDRLATGLLADAGDRPRNDPPSFREEDFDFSPGPTDRGPVPSPSEPEGFGPPPALSDVPAPRFDEPRPLEPPAINVPDVFDIATRLDEIAGLYADSPDRRAAFVAEATRRLAAAPADLRASVVADWYADLTRQGSDPEPSTDMSTPLSTRIARHRDSRRF